VSRKSDGESENTIASARKHSPDSLCGWETLWLAQALGERLRGLRIDRLVLAAGSTLVLHVEGREAREWLYFWLSSPGGTVFPGPVGIRSKPGEAGDIVEWSSALKGAVIENVEACFPHRSLIITCRRGASDYHLLLDPVKSGGNLYLLDEHMVILRRIKNRGFSAGNVLKPEVVRQPQGHFTDLYWSPGGSVPAGMNGSFCSRMMCLDDSQRLALEKNPPSCEALALFYGGIYAPADTYADFWSACCTPIWREFRTAMLRTAMLAPAKNRRTRLERSLRRMQSDLRKLGDPDKHRRKGDLLAANLHLIKKGAESVEVDDLFSETGGKVAIAMDPAMEPQQNLQRYYARYAKAKRGIEEIERRSTSARRKLIKVEKEIERINAIENIETLPKGVSTGKPGKPGKAAPTGGGRVMPAGVQHWRTADGYDLFLGRSADGNDRLVRQVMRGRDYWFHVADSPGSHVVLRFSGKGAQPPESAIKEAARLAHFNSPQRDEKAVAVSCVPGKWVRKKKGDAPGLVHISHPRTIMVDPDPGLFKRLTKA
jgi:predicted ribosome quality control (RQC) complex YloA/Tae2 family protein